MFKILLFVVVAVAFVEATALDQYALGSTVLGSDQHVTIQYFGIEPAGEQGCNLNKGLYAITTQVTDTCTVGCQRYSNNSYVSTDCDNRIFFPRGSSWVERIVYQDVNCLLFTNAAFLPADQCIATSTDFQYQTCNEDTVFTYSCTDIICHKCKLLRKTPKGTCNNGQQVLCITG